MKSKTKRKMSLKSKNSHFNNRGSRLFLKKRKSVKVKLLNNLLAPPSKKSIIFLINQRSYKNLARKN
jgi:hypothetical protein